MQIGTKLNLSLSARNKLADKLQNGSAVLSFQEDPALASLCTCLGLQFEMGHSHLDRLSPFFGIEMNLSKENPWRSHIFTKEEEIGICLSPKDGKPLKVRHPDLRYIISPESFNEQGTLTKIIIYPNRVAGNYLNKGFELVIVRDWLLATALNPDPDSSVSYLYVNPWEINTNISRMQVALMHRKQLAFFGTHDVVDHLLGADQAKYSCNIELFHLTERRLNQIFAEEENPSLAQLSLSYLIGVLLDDLAQPKWYSSESHLHLIQLTMDELEKTKAGTLPSILALPISFHKLMESVRNIAAGRDLLSVQFNQFKEELGLQNKKKGTSEDVPNQFDRSTTAEVGFSYR